jgi:2-hydroxychromene-2-carboxylate isomerase
MRVWEVSCIGNRRLTRAGTIVDLPERQCNVVIAVGASSTYFWSIAHRKLRPRLALEVGTASDRDTTLGQLISLAQRRVARAAADAPRGRPRATFLFDLASPWTYLAAERVDRRFGGVHWRPAMAEALGRGPRAVGSSSEAAREAVERRAAELRMPLVWPEAGPGPAPAAMRVATLAAERERAAAFVLAAGRLTFCGGYDIEEPEILAEAAAAAGLGLDECLRAAADVRRDAPLEQAALGLLRRGADQLPALVIGRAVHCGEGGLEAAAAAASAPRRSLRA